MGVKRSTWIIGTVAAALILIALGWVLAISPTLATAEARSADADAAEQRSQILRVQLNSLKEQFENKATYEAELAGLATQIPPDADLADYLRGIDALAQASGVTVVSVNDGVPLDVVPSVVVETATEAPDTTGVEEPAAGTEAGSSEEPADGAATEQPTLEPAGAAPIPGFVAVPVDVTIVSGVPQALAFVEGLQNTADRLFLVTALNGKGQAEAEAANGRPATALGDIELQVTGYIYVLVDSTPVEETPDEGADPTLPVPPDGKARLEADA